MAGIIQVVLERDGHDQPWGFRLQGGADVAMPLSVQRILVGTPADGTLLKGDIITRISCTETKGITHQQAADLFGNAGNQIAVYIKRVGVTAAPAPSQAPAPSAAAPLVNGSPTQPASVPVSGGVGLPGLTSNTTATADNPVVRSLPRTHFVAKPKPNPAPRAPTINMDTLSIQHQPYRTVPLVQPTAKLHPDLGAGSINHLKMQDEHITGAKEPMPAPSSQAEKAKSMHDELVMKQKVTGSLQQIQQTQQSLSSASQQIVENKTVVNKQYNSPLPLYSAENVQEAVRQQTSPSHTPAVNPVNKPQKQMGLRGMPLSYDPEQSATWQIIHEEENCQLITEHGPTESKVYSI